MRAAVFAGPRSIEVADRPDPVVAALTDAVVRVMLTCVCGSDLWYYRGESPHAPGPIGHEFVGVVEQVGADVYAIPVGDLVVAPFKYCDGTCAHCRAGWPSNCVAGGAFGTDGFDGGQGEAVRVPFADATLVVVPGSGHSDATMAGVLTLSDVMSTGHHAVVSAGLTPRSVVAVAGDRAVGLCAVSGGAPARTYIPEFLDDVLEGRIHPGRVFDFETDLDGIGEAYAAMDERRAIKSLVRVGTV